MIANQNLSCLYKPGASRTNETKYLGLFNSIDETDFYFSYELDLTRTVTELGNELIMNQE